MERKIHIYSNKSELLSSVAEKMTRTIEKAAQENRKAYFALAGGNTPRELYALLANLTYKSSIKWDNVHLFWGDERTVPPDHQDSNFGMVQQALLAHITIPGENVHRIRGEIKPKQAAAEYSKLLHKHFKENPPRFDLILLGVGEDGHTASLFPHTDVLEELNQPVAAVFVPSFNTWRVTLTLPVTNAAKEVIFLISGRSKSEIVQRIMNLEQPTKELPATLVHPENGILHWMLDSEAALLINKRK